jgi:hypothetical protein
MQTKVHKLVDRSEPPAVRPVRRRVAGPDERARLQAAAGGPPAATNLPRAVRSTAVRDGYAEFLARFPLDVFFTLTFTDAYAQEHFVYSPTSALNNLERWFQDIGYKGQWFAAAEPHFDRDVPHLHGLMESRGLPLATFWGEWFASRGRARFEDPRSDAAAIYCSKYALKDYAGDSLRFDLRFRSRRERKSEPAGSFGSSRGVPCHPAATIEPGGRESGLKAFGKPSPSSHSQAVLAL